MTLNTAIKMLNPAQTMWESDGERYCVVADTYTDSIKGYDYEKGSAPIAHLGRPSECDASLVAAEWFRSKGDH